MGETPAATVAEIERTRERLDDEVRQLQALLPAPVALAKRIVAVALGSGALGSAVWFVVRRRRRARATNDVKEFDRRLRRVERWVELRSYA
jgi:hypothetical protein